MSMYPYPVSMLINFTACKILSSFLALMPAYEIILALMPAYERDYSSSGAGLCEILLALVPAYEILLALVPAQF